MYKMTGYCNDCGEKTNHLEKWGDRLVCPNCFPVGKYNQRKTLIDQAVGVTLNGKKAVIQGARLSFAYVSQIPSGLSIEYSWDVIEYRVKMNRLDFQSY